MKHIFLINPAAGKKGNAESIIRPQIEDYCGKAGLDYEIYVTKCQGDAQNYCREHAKSGEALRFYACGGDGTLYEVVNGAYGYPNCEVAVIPLGSGNDFVRLFGTKEQFCNVEAQVTGIPVELDVIKCGDKIAINQCSMGMDAEVCAKQSYFKKMPLMTGETAYVAAALQALCKKIGHEFTITIDDGEPIKQDVLLCVAANSRWYGGGYMGAPKAIPDDGLLDCIIVENTVSRLKLAGLVNQYKNGQHLCWDFTNFLRGKKMHIESKEPAAVNVDGECQYVTETTFEMLEGAANLVIPTTSDYLERKAKGEL